MTDWAVLTWWKEVIPAPLQVDIGTVMTGWVDLFFACLIGPAAGGATVGSGDWSKAVSLKVAV